MKTCKIPSKDINYLVFFLMVSLFITFLSRNIPFFWDSVLISSIANLYYENQISGLIVPVDLDVGHIPTCGLYVSFFWKIFGKSLLSSHLAFMPFMFGFYYGFYKLSRKLLKSSLIIFAVLLILVNPVILTQQIFMAYDIVLAGAFIWAMIMLLENRRALYSVLLVLLLLISIRGLYFVLGLFLCDIFLNYKNIKEQLLRKITPYLIFSCVLVIWLVYHKMQTGWYLIPDNLEDTHRSILGLGMILRQLIYMAWKLSDFGIIIIWISAIMITTVLLKNKLADNKFKQLLSFLLIITLVLSLGMAVLSNPVGHKYFIVIYCLVTILAANIFIIFKKQFVKWSILLFFVLVLTAGNFILYPVKFANGWDCSLKTLPYFSLEKELKSYVLEHNINPSEVYTYFPVYNNHKNSYLQNDFAYAKADEADINKCPYFIVSNIYNVQTPDELMTLTKNWLLLKHLKKGQIFLTLYKNPSSAIKNN